MFAGIALKWKTNIYFSLCQRVHLRTLRVIVLLCWLSWLSLLPVLSSMSSFSLVIKDTENVLCHFFPLLLFYCRHLPAAVCFVPSSCLNVSDICWTADGSVRFVLWLVLDVVAIAVFIKSIYVNNKNDNVQENQNVATFAVVNDYDESNILAAIDSQLSLASKSSPFTSSLSSHRSQFASNSCAKRGIGHFLIVRVINSQPLANTWNSCT